MKRKILVRVRKMAADFAQLLILLSMVEAHSPGAEQKLSDFMNEMANNKKKEGEGLRGSGSILKEKNEYRIGSFVEEKKSQTQLIIMTKKS
jgi:hypothetical protein